MSTRHSATRVPHEVMRREIVVVSAENITPSMRRFVFAAESLKTFKSLGHDDHVKIFFPGAADAGDRPWIARDFTPRRFDAEKALLTIDFALHQSGPATSWARQAKPGDTLEIGGPKGSLVIADDFDWYLMIGDETALPAIGRRLEELRPGVPVTTIIVVANQREEQHISTAAAWTPIWLHRDDADALDEQLILRVLKETSSPAGDGHIWLAGESAMIRSLRSYLINDRARPAEWVRAAGYWKRGAAGAHEKF